MDGWMDGCVNRWTDGVPQVLAEYDLQGGSNMTGTDLRVNKPHCAAAVRP